jgi:type IV pilus assembly protein PilO
MAGLKRKSGGGSLDNLSLTGKVMVGVLFTLMVGVAYFVVFYGEIDGQIEGAQNALIQKKAALEKARDADAAYNKDLTELERRRQLERKQRNILPDESQAHAFLSAIQTVATISGVQLTSWTPQDEEAQEFYAKVPMELKLSGRFHQVAKFFHGVGQIDRIINMENITIKVKASAKPADDARPGEESTALEVQALATAFRALKSGETAGGGRDRRGGKK